MRAVQRHTESQESRAPSADTTPVQRRDSLQGLDYATAVQRLAPVQLKEDTANVHAAAQRGTSGGGGSLPYLGQIQKSFGSHDVSGIKSHTGGKASEACESMGAEAFASGQDVAFKGQPDLHTAAHEAAHIVQQRAGVQLSGGVGKAGDPYEKNADEVADRVVQGKSAEVLLGGPSFGGAAAVQRSIQMKGGLLDSLKSFFLEAKLTGPQQKVAKILAEKHGVDVSGLPTGTFASLYKDAGGDNPKQSPEKTAANMASAARDHVGAQPRKPTQKRESGVVSGTAIQRKESRQIQRSVAPKEEGTEPPSPQVDDIESTETEVDDTDDAAFWEALAEVTSAPAEEVVQMKAAGGTSVQMQSQATKRANTIKQTRARLGPFLKQAAARHASLKRLAKHLWDQEKVLRELTHEATRCAQQNEWWTAWSAGAANILAALGGALSSAASVPTAEKVLTQPLKLNAKAVVDVTAKATKDTGASKAAEAMIGAHRAAIDVATAPGRMEIPPEASAMLSIALDIIPVAMAPTPVNIAFAATKVISTIVQKHNEDQVEKLWALVPQIKSQYLSVRGQANAVTKKAQLLEAKLKRLATFK